MEEGDFSEEEEDTIDLSQQGADEAPPGKEQFF